MGRAADQITKYYNEKILEVPYQFCHYKKFDYNILKYIRTLNAAGQGRPMTYNDVIIMADTETSKKKPDRYDKVSRKWYTTDNHVVCWTISLRAFHHNIVTLYGRKPSRMIETLLRIHQAMMGMYTVVYFHNFPYFCIFFSYDPLILQPLFYPATILRS